MFSLAKVNHLFFVVVRGFLCCYGAIHMWPPDFPHLDFWGSYVLIDCPDWKFKCPILQMGAVVDGPTEGRMQLVWDVKFACRFFRAAYKRWRCGLVVVLCDFLNGIFPMDHTSEHWNGKHGTAPFHLHLHWKSNCNQSVCMFSFFLSYVVCLVLFFAFSVCCQICAIF